MITVRTLQAFACSARLLQQHACVAGVQVCYPRPWHVTCELADMPFVVYAQHSGDTSLLMGLGQETKPLLVRVGSESHLIASNPTGRSMPRIQSEGHLSSMVPVSPSGNLGPAQLQAQQLGAGHHLLGQASAGSMPRALSVAQLSSIDEMNATGTYPSQGMLGLSGELELGEFKGQQLQGMYSSGTSQAPR